jgi:hypothetical protein
MSFLAAEVFGVLMRWVHLASVVFTIGGFAYARLVEVPSLAAIPPEDRSAMMPLCSARFRPLIYSGIAGLLVSGLCNFLINPGHSRYYYTWFGIKMLLALHVFAAGLLVLRPSGADPDDQARRARRMSGILISGLLTILVAAYLRRIY